MGYVGNNLATLVCGVFAAVLTGLWFVMPGVLNFVFMMAVPIMWFLTFMCWIVQKAQESSHKYTAGYGVKKNHNNPRIAITQTYTAQGKIVTNNEISTARSKFGNDLEELQDTVKLKDGKIEHLKQEIENLQTRVQIEEIKSELANLKKLASQNKPKRKTRKK